MYNTQNTSVFCILYMYTHAHDLYYECMTGIIIFSWRKYIHNAYDIFMMSILCFMHVHTCAYIITWIYDKYYHIFITKIHSSRKYIHHTYITLNRCILHICIYSRTHLHICIYTHTFAQVCEREGGRERGREREREKVGERERQRARAHARAPVRPIVRWWVIVWVLVSEHADRAMRAMDRVRSPDRCAMDRAIERHTHTGAAWG